MERPYVDRVRVENFRCIKQVDLHLTPLHALIGPNDSGKSSLLKALVDSPHRARLWISSLRAGYDQDGIHPGTFPHVVPGGLPDAITQKAASSFFPVRLLRFDPDELRAPGALIPKQHELWFQSERGKGLASLYDALLARDRDAFSTIDARFRALFPTCKALRLENADFHSKTLGLTLVDGTDVGPNEMSEGMLYWLAFAIIERLQAPAILVLEEPENGLHPARVSEVMRILRELSKRTQIIVATHSPLVINELKPEEVTIVTRTKEQGTICTPMTQTKNFAQRSEIYALGELWLSYADGELEKELVGPSTDATTKAG